jgi:hypothetical protein
MPKAARQHNNSRRTRLITALRRGKQEFFRQNYGPGERYGEKNIALKRGGPDVDGIGALLNAHTGKSMPELPQKVKEKIWRVLLYEIWSSKSIAAQ